MIEIQDHLYFSNITFIILIKLFEDFHILMLIILPFFNNFSNGNKRIDQLFDDIWILIQGSAIFTCLCCDQILSNFRIWIFKGISLFIPTFLHFEHTIILLKVLKKICYYFHQRLLRMFAHFIYLFNIFIFVHDKFLL